jgi:ketol-acid reductoisomerase
MELKPIQAAFAHAFCIHETLCQPKRRLVVPLVTTGACVSWQYVVGAFNV